MDHTAASQLPSGKVFGFWQIPGTFAHEIHVDIRSPHADDMNDGSPGRPLASINAAAARAVPGTRILIHEGVYRECVQPVRGGDGPETMISYESYQSDHVVIKASEVAEAFEPSTDYRLNRDPFAGDLADVKIWKIRLNPDMFRGYNPFTAMNILHDRLFIEYDKTDMTTYLNRRGMVFCDGEPLVQVPLYHQMSEAGGTYWVEANGQTVHFRLRDDADPKDRLIEVTCREQCFVPENPFLAYIRVKGLTCAHAAGGAPVPQRGSISLNRGHHWIIEDCTIDWANGVGIDIGNQDWHYKIDDDQILGFNVIRRCTISQAGVCGIAAMFVESILVEDNLIEGTGWQRMELSWEAAGLKAHACRDSLFRRNIFRKTIRADHLWLDVANENNRITSNLFLDGIEQREAIFIEFSRDGINLIDNNIIWNVEGRFDPEDVKEEPGSSGWYKLEDPAIVNGYAVYGEGTDHLRIAHNLIGHCRSSGYYAKAVPFRFERSGRGGTSRDAEICSNIFYACGEAAIKFPTEKNVSNGNLFLNMPGGYLRILYPAPAVCLDLAGWQEYYGLDTYSAEGELQISIDTASYQMTVQPARPRNLPKRWQRDEEEYVRQPERIKPVDPYKLVRSDFAGVSRYGKDCLPGPFTEIRQGITIDIDPRKIDS